MEKYRVTLTPDERHTLEKLVLRGYPSLNAVYGL
jgi:hypothetical protein